ncbi:MAG: DUF4209 domain-containing protein [Alphaproteobacteria bacterium]|nr:DUF4209 domain-containing protein [Alphaproteobacteria bacterium]
MGSEEVNRQEPGKEPIVTSEQILALNYEQYLSDTNIIDADFHGRASNRNDIDSFGDGQEAYTLISRILQIHARFDDTADPYGPMFVLNDRRSMIPSDIDYAQAIELAKAASSFSNAGIRARIADIAWLCNRRDRETAELAIRSYIEAVNLVKTGTAKHEFDSGSGLGRCSVKLLQRAFQISHAIKGKKHYDPELVKALQDIVDHALSKRQANLYFWTMELAYNYGIGDRKAHPQHVESAAYWEGTESNWAKHLLELAANSYRSLRKADDENRCWISIAEKSVEISGAGASSMYEASWLMTAIEELRRARGPEAKQRTEELRKRLRDVQENVHFELGIHSYELDFTALAQKSLARVKDLTWGSVLAQFACLSRSPDPEELKEEARKALFEDPLSSLVSSQKMDREGKIVSRVPSMLDENDISIMDKISQVETHRRYIMVYGSLKPIRYLIQSETSVTANDFMVICNHSAFVPKGYEAVFVLGFARFFQGDMISAANILIPLLENSLRYILKTSGRDTSKIESDMTQEDSALSRLLDKEVARLEAIFGKPILFEIDLLFNSRHGPRVRHEHAHGKLAAGNCYSDDVTYACWFLFHLTCLPLLGDWTKISREIDEVAEGRTGMVKPAEEEVKS